MSRRDPYFVTCAPGLEPVLHDEVRQLRFARVERQVGGVYFEGTIADAWHANLHLRTAVRVLLRLARFEAADADALYRGVSEIDWATWLRPDGAFIIDAQLSDSSLTHSRFVEQRVKDAIVDQCLARHNTRPSIDRSGAQLHVHVHISRDRCTLSLDTSGESLHKRGWRVHQGRAPLAETLAAAVVTLSGWDRRSPLVDPFCGSGTILIEAGLLACGVAPGSFREWFSFEAWPSHDASAFAALRQYVRDEARSRVTAARKLMLRGLEADPNTAEEARENAARAGLDDRVVIETSDALLWQPKRGWGAWVVTNPPYGERVGEAGNLHDVYRAFGALLREQADGYHLALLSGDRRLTRALGLKADRIIPLKNGGLDCELLLATFWQQ